MPYLVQGIHKRVKTLLEKMLILVKEHKLVGRVCFGEIICVISQNCFLLQSVLSGQVS